MDFRIVYRLLLKDIRRAYAQLGMHSLNYICITSLFWFSFVLDSLLAAECRRSVSFPCERHRWQAELIFSQLSDSFPLFFLQRTTDADALELFNKKVRIVHAKTGDVTYNFFQPAEGMEKVKKGGNAVTKEFSWIHFCFFFPGAEFRFSAECSLSFIDHQLIGHRRRGHVLRYPPFASNGTQNKWNAPTNEFITKIEWIRPQNSHCSCHIRLVSVSVAAALHGTYFTVETHQHLIFRSLFFRVKCTLIFVDVVFFPVIWYTFILPRIFLSSRL